MDERGLQMLKPSPSVIHCHTPIISETLIHSASVQDHAKSIRAAPICVCSGAGKENIMLRRQVNSSLCCFKALCVL